MYLQINLRVLVYNLTNLQFRRNVFLKDNVYSPIDKNIVALAQK